MSQRGSINLPVVIAGVLALGLAASAYLNIVQHQNAQQDHKLLQGQITDLTYQVKQDHLDAGNDVSASPTPSPLATPDPSPTVTPTPTPAVLDASTPKTTTVKKSGNVHLAANTSSKVLLPYTKLPVGTSVVLGAASGQWQQITVNGITGFILASSLN